MKVLVALGSRNGSTAGVAEMIASALRGEGIDADVASAGGVRDVSGYAAVVLGGALYAGRWDGDARKFAPRHAKAMAGRPVWLFSSGPLDDSADKTDIPPPVAHVRVAMNSLQAREYVTFGGRLTEQAKGFIAKSMVHNGRGGDLLNPDRIAAWSRAVANALRSEPASAPRQT